MVIYYNIIKIVFPGEIPKIRIIVRVGEKGSIKKIGKTKEPHGVLIYSCFVIGCNFKSSLAKKEGG